MAPEENDTIRFSDHEIRDWAHLAAGPWAKRRDFLENLLSIHQSPWIDVGDETKDGPELDWLIEGFLPLKYLAVLGGDSKCGKTWFVSALAEQVDLDMMDKNPPASLAGKRAKPRFTFRWVVGNMRKAKRSPTMGSMIQKTGITLEQAEAKWEDVRSRIKAHLDPLPGNDAPACKHPFFGLLSAADLLDLLDAHQHYHDERFPQV